MSASSVPEPGGFAIVSAASLFATIASDASVVVVGRENLQFDLVRDGRVTGQLYLAPDEVRVYERGLKELVSCSGSVRA